jgi:hypothetical protein
VQQASTPPPPDTKALLADLRRSAASDPAGALRTAPMFLATERGYLAP